MHTPDWVADSVFYQIFPDRFASSRRLPKEGLNLEDWASPPTAYGFKGGDLLGIVEHLDYLRDLGVNALYLTPVFSSAANHRYHTYDYFRVDPLLGGNRALRELIDTAHSQGLRIVLDGVFNHASRGLWQFHHTLENGSSSPYVDWFHFDPDRLARRQPWGAYPSPAETRAIQSQGSLRAIGYEGWWDLPALPKFNTRTPAVREFIFSVAEHWTRFGIDGWRLDVPGEIDDDGFWREFRQRVKAINQDAYIVGEIWDDARRWLQGDQFDASMNYPVTAACLSFFGGTRLNVALASQPTGFSGQVAAIDAGTFHDRIDRLLTIYPTQATRVQLNPLDTHDTPRFLSCCNGDLASLRLAVTFLLTFPGAPCIFYGDEIGLPGGPDPDCRRAFPWSEASWNTDLRELTRHLIRIRRSRPALRRGDFRRLHSEGGLYVFERRHESDVVVTALNVGDNDATAAIVLPATSGGSPRVLAGPPDLLLEQNGRIRIPGRTGAVLGLDASVERFQALRAL